MHPCNTFEYRISSKSHCGEILFRDPVRCSNNSRMASTEIEKHAALTVSIAAHCMYEYCTYVHMYYSGRPFTIRKISKVAFNLPESVARFQGWQ